MCVYGSQFQFAKFRSGGDLLRSFKDAIEPGYRQGAIYKINCSDCDQCYLYWQN